MKRLNNNGFSLVEVIVASLVFALSVGGFYAALSSVKTASSSSDKELQAAQFGKQVLESLRDQVDASTWDQEGNKLSTDGASTTKEYTYTFDPPAIIKGVTYTATYKVTPVDPTDIRGGPRKVEVSVSWAD